MKQNNNSTITYSSQRMLILIVLLVIFSLIIFYIASIQRSNVHNQIEISPDLAVTPLPVVPNGQEDQGDGVFCTLEAKLCSDGSYVSRVPPNCEFSPCPEEDLVDPDDKKTDVIDLQISY